MPRDCKNHPDGFCYVYGKFTTKTQQRPIKNNIKKICKLYVDCPLGDRNKRWAPHIYVLHAIVNYGIGSAMPRAILMIWREPKDHLNDCYFCCVDTNGFSSKNRHLLVYPSVDSAIRPVPHDATLPIPVAPGDALNSMI